MNSQAAATQIVGWLSACGTKLPIANSTFFLTLRLLVEATPNAY